MNTLVGKQAGHYPGPVIRPEEQPATHNALRNAALTWAQLGAQPGGLEGLTIGPLKGKIPMPILRAKRAGEKGGMYQFSNDATTVHKWWEKYPTANIGGRPPKGTIVIDIDVKNGGPDYFRNLCAGRVLPDTLTVLTGSGGWHLWFKLPFNPPAGLRGQLAETSSGIDIKGHNGYLVMPPSVHPSTGGLYITHNNAPLAPLPEWLRRHAFHPLKRTHALYTPTPQRKRNNAPNTPQTLEKRRAAWVEKVRTAPEGNRNKCLFWAACRDAETGRTATTELINAAIANGLPESAVKKTVRSAQKHVAAEGAQ